MFEKQQEDRGVGVSSQSGATKTDIWKKNQTFSKTYLKEKREKKDVRQCPSAARSNMVPNMRTEAHWKKQTKKNNIPSPNKSSTQSHESIQSSSMNRQFLHWWVGERTITPTVCPSKCFCAGRVFNRHSYFVSCLVPIRRTNVVAVETPPTFKTVERPFLYRTILDFTSWRATSSITCTHAHFSRFFFGFHL